MHKCSCVNGRCEFSLFSIRALSWIICGICLPVISLLVFKNSTLIFFFFWYKWSWLQLATPGKRQLSCVRPDRTFQRLFLFLDCPQLIGGELGALEWLSHGEEPTWEGWQGKQIPGIKRKIDSWWRYLIWIPDVNLYILFPFFFFFVFLAELFECNL